MFETLQNLTAEQVDDAASALAMGDLVLCKADPRGVFIAIKPCPSHEVDFCAVTVTGSNPIRTVPVPLTQLQFAVLHLWSEKNIPALCRRWRELDDGSHQPEKVPEELPGDGGVD